jgi:hypothetical protein
MTRKKLLLSATAAALLAAFNPAFAGGGAKHGSAEDLSPPSATTEESLPSAEQRASSSSSASSDDMNVGAGVSVDRESGDTERNAQGQGPSEMSSSAGGTSHAPQGEKRSVDPDRLTGLDGAHPAN